MTKLRVGLVGLGMMGRHHLRILSELEGVTLVGIFDPASDKNTVARDFPVFLKLEDLLSCNLDYCVVAAPTAFHLEIGLKLAAAKVHALIEKPLATNSKEAALLVNAFEKAGLIGGVGHIERYNPAIQAMRDRIREGLIGDIYQVSTRRQGPYPARIADVGVIKDLATHDIDLTTWVTRSKYRSIFAHTSKRIGRLHEDMVVAIGILDGGIIVNHVVNWLTPFKERNTLVIGEHGALLADTLTVDLTHFENGHVQQGWDTISAFRGVSEGNLLRYALERIEPLKREHIEFRDAIVSGATERLITFKEGLSTVEVADRMLNS